ncbi:SCO family protein [Consotaella aegiceratis]|uniref:SCO family protein n=1 Tax=Consotaella aegiceratis TaxID=3097961 RepID=UPI002F425855
MRTRTGIILAGAAVPVLVGAVIMVMSAWTEADESIGGPFTMTSDLGQTVTEADLKGKPSVIYFGFTSCPEVCPTTLNELALLMSELGDDADKLNYVMVSVDPEQDTVELLHDYLGIFDERIRGFVGTPEQLRQMADGYRVYYQKVPTEYGYTMDHTATVYLMDADTHFFGTISYQEDHDTALGKLKRLIESNSGWFS